MPENKILRLRMVAGPNGSGKSSFINDLKNEVKLGYYINADEIESSLLKHKFIDFNNYGLNISSKNFTDSLSKNAELIEKSSMKIRKTIRVENNLLVTKNVDSYLSAFIADFIREKMIQKKNSFTFETVMSHISKVNFLKKAKDKNYRCYLYYICTDDYSINLNRINNRVEKGGHNVDENKTRERYFRSLEYLHNAIQNSDRAFIFDNSKENIQIAEVTNGTELVLKVDIPPVWFTQYVLKYFK